MKLFGRRFQGRRFQGTLEEYLLERSVIDEKTGCRLWQMSTGGQGGYGYFLWHGKWTYAHRAAYEIWVGPIPKEKLICHHCDNPICFNPDHLFLGTQKDNLKDMHAKGRYISNSNALKQAWAEGRMRYTPRTRDPLTGRFRSSHHA